MFFTIPVGGPIIDEREENKLIVKREENKLIVMKKLNQVLHAQNITNIGISFNVYQLQ